jgi:hypothetical protein
MNDDRIRAALTNGAPPVPDPAFVDRLEGRLVAELAEPARRGRPRLQALVAVATAVVFLLAGGYLLRPQPNVAEPALPPVLESPDSPPASTDTTATSSTTVMTTVAGRISGALPDGTSFLITAPEAPLVVEGISAAIVLDRADGSSPVIGITSFNRIGRAGEGEWRVDIDLYDDIQAELGGSVDDMVGVFDVDGFPVLELTPPLRFATDDEVPLRMAVQFEGFSVIRGCGPTAWRCSWFGAVQVVPIDVERPEADPPGPAGVWIESLAPRWQGDPSYLDPGPLSPRGDHFVGWTGEELLVYGGFPGDGDGSDGLTDGAAFDPVTNQWRLIAAAPEGVGSSGAVWTGAEMVGMSGTDTFAYDPDLDRWRTVAGPAPVSGSKWEAVFDGTGVVAWLDMSPRTAAGLDTSPRPLARLDLTNGQWLEVQPPPFESSEPWARSLRVVDGAVFAIGLSSEACTPYRVARLDGTAWEEVPPPPFAEDYWECLNPGDSMGIDGRLVVWGSKDQRTASFDPDSVEWTELGALPLADCGDASSLGVDDSVLVESCGVVAVLDLATGSWRQSFLPGSLGIGFDAVWTGDEILMWGNPCCYGTGRPLGSVDAWRWKPHLSE